MNGWQKVQCRVIIRIAAADAVEVGAKMSRPLCNDTASLMPVYRKMATSLGKVFRVALSESEVEALLNSFLNGAIRHAPIEISETSVLSRGNAANAAMASSVTKRLGWALAEVISGRRG